jgi:hypothetical protein
MTNVMLNQAYSPKPHAYNSHILLLNEPHILSPIFYCLPRTVIFLLGLLLEVHIFSLF